MDDVARFNAQTSGRDKLFRFVQYLSRFVWSLLNKNNRQHLTIEKLQRLEDALSSARKLLQFGRFADMMHSALKSMSVNDPTLRVTITTSRIATSLFLFSDNLVWLSKLGLVQSIDRLKWTKTANKLWLYSIMMNLLRDLYEIRRIIASYQRRSEPFVTAPSPSRSSCSRSPASLVPPEFLAIKNLLVAHKSVSVDVLKNMCDFFIPLAALGHVSLSPTTVGFLGTISSAAAILQLIDYSARLSPS